MVSQHCDLQPPENLAAKPATKNPAVGRARDLTRQFRPYVKYWFGENVDGLREETVKCKRCGLVVPERSSKDGLCYGCVVGEGQTQ